MLIKKSLDNLRNIFKKVVLPIYWAFLTFMLLKPGVENKEYWFMFSGIDKIIHLSIFAFLGFSLMLSFKNLKFPLFFIIILLYGFATEIAQNLMGLGRSFELYDILADMVGAIIGYYIYSLFIKITSNT